MKKICLVALLSIIILPASRIIACSNASLNSKIQHAIDQERMQYNIPGIQVSISLPNERTTRDFVSGTTELNGETAVTTGNLFQIGSLTKSFVTAIILQLEAEHKLNINDPIGKYINFSAHPLWPTSWKTITIKQLLNMTSGIFNFVEDKDFYQQTLTNFKRIWQLPELVDVAAKHKDYFAQGKGWHYSNTGYALAGMIITAITNNSVGQEMNERLLGATNYNLLNTYYADYNYSSAIMKQMVHGYYAYNPKILDVTTSNVSSRSAGGGMVANTRDIVRWVRTLFTGNVLKAKQLAEMKQLVCQGDDSNCIPGKEVSLKVGGFSLGLSESYTKAYGYIWFYKGSWIGYIAEYAWIPERDVVIAIAMNCKSPKVDAHGMDFILDILKVLNLSSSK